MSSYWTPSKEHQIAAALSEKPWIIKHMTLAQRHQRNASTITLIKQNRIALLINDVCLFWVPVPFHNHPPPFIRTQEGITHHQRSPFGPH